MFNVSSFLDKFKKIKDPREDLLSIVFILNESLGIDISPSNVTFRGNIVSVKENGALKSALYLHKEKIMRNFREKIPHLRIDDIR